jgi:hypothetical protein
MTCLSHFQPIAIGHSWTVVNLNKKSLGKRSALNAHPAFVALCKASVNKE